MKVSILYIYIQGAYRWSIKVFSTIILNLSVLNFYYQNLAPSFTGKMWWNWNFICFFFLSIFCDFPKSGWIMRIYETGLNNISKFVEQIWRIFKCLKLNFLYNKNFIKNNVKNLFAGELSTQPMVNLEPSTLPLLLFLSPCSSFLPYLSSHFQGRIQEFASGEGGILYPSPPTLPLSAHPSSFSLPYKN